MSICKGKWDHHHCNAQLWTNITSSQYVVISRFRNVWISVRSCTRQDFHLHAEQNVEAILSFCIKHAEFIFIIIYKDTLIYYFTVILVLSTAFHCMERKLTLYSCTVEFKRQQWWNSCGGCTKYSFYQQNPILYMYVAICMHFDSLLSNKSSA